MELISYQLLILVEKNSSLEIGALGLQQFPAGVYIYTGSARRGIRARVQRHLRSQKKLRWHIDYLLHSPAVKIVAYRLSPFHECELNQKTGGQVWIPRFGASDCRRKCGSHLKKLPSVRKYSEVISASEGNWIVWEGNETIT